MFHLSELYSYFINLFTGFQRSDLGDIHHDYESLAHSTKVITGILTVTNVIIILTICFINKKDSWPVLMPILDNLAQFIFQSEFCMNTVLPFVSKYIMIITLHGTQLKS